MLTLEDLKVALAEQGDSAWVPAAEPIFPPIGGGTASHLFGLQISPADRAMLQPSDQASFAGAPLPPKVDWRSDGGGRVTKVKHQGDCGSCVAFATCAVMESAHMIGSGAVLDLSEAHLFYCNGGSCLAGWSFVPALEAARMIGIGLQSDFPYVAHDVACVQIKPAVTLKSYRRALSRAERKRALVSGPVIGGMQVFSDFAFYKSGIYRHVSGDFEGNHAIAVVGYDDEDGCWICKNSWGQDFGEDGYFRIAYGECELDDVNPFYAVELA
ncbi:MAG: cysteine protease [Caulobacteraceae bacterium]|nr:cysteine protease [Caulobacteraceae bacterium]